MQKTHISIEMIKSCFIFSQCIKHMIVCWYINKHGCLLNRICIHVLLLRILFSYFFNQIKSVFHFDWICGEIYTSLKNTCLFPMDISTRLLHVYFRYMSLNVVNYRSCYSSSNLPIRTPFLWNPWAFKKCVILFFYLHFLMNKMIYTIYHILNCMMGLILENYWMFPTRLWTQNATLILRWYAIYETRFIDISRSMSFIVVQRSVQNTWKKIFIGFHYIS